MQAYTSYSAAFKAAFASQTFAVAQLQHIRLPMNIDTSGCYKLFFFRSGGKKFHIDGDIYQIQPGDLFFVNQRQWHYFSQISKSEDHERIVVFIYPDYLKALSTPQTNLRACFQENGGGWPCRALDPAARERFVDLICRLSSADGFGADVLTLSAFLELLVLANTVYQSGETAKKPQPEQQPGQSAQVQAILHFIDEHMTQELTLEVLSGQFYLTPSYLCRIFKKETGTTIHKYITAKRITLAKDLLTGGSSVTDACSKSGFRDYNGFLKAFVSAVGMPPKKYAQLGR